MTISVGEIPSGREGSVRWAASFATDIGAIRSVNEDSFLERSSDGFWAVADGMGGHQRGDYASGQLVRQLARLHLNCESRTALEFIQREVEKVNRELWNLGQSLDQTVGTTVVALLARGNRCTCLWAGDSRLYHYGKLGFRQVSRDHAYLNELVDAGLLEHANALTTSEAMTLCRAVGGESEIALDYESFTCDLGDKILLCSDGLGVLDDRELESILSHGGTPDQTAARVLERSLALQPNDNVTIGIVQIL